MPYVNDNSLHILDPKWAHVTIKPEFPFSGFALLLIYTCAPLNAGPVEFFVLGASTNHGGG